MRISSACVEMSDGQRVDPFPECGAGDRGRVDRIGFVRLAHRLAGAFGEPGRNPDHSIATRD
jgi:hypothetical protein